jgi:hypothetical protein
MQLGFVYFVFLPSIVTTLVAGWAVVHVGARRTLWAGLALAGLGLPLLLLPNLWAVLLGLVLIGVGTFFVQARRRASSAAPRLPIVVPPAACIWPAISPAAWLGRQSSVKPSIGSVGQPALPVSPFRSASRQR